MKIMEGVVLDSLLVSPSPFGVSEPVSPSASDEDIALELSPPAKMVTEMPHHLHQDGDVVLNISTDGNRCSLWSSTRRWAHYHNTHNF